MRALDDLLKEGKVRYVGVSNFSVSLIEEAMGLLKNGEIISNQIEYNLLQRDVETEILPFQRENGIATIAYSPLAMGGLSGKYDEKSELDEKDYRRNDPLFMNKENLAEAQKLIGVMREIGESHEATPAEVALNWLLKSDDIFPIFGSKNTEQAQSNINASKWSLSEDELKSITAASDNLNLDFSIDFSKL
jgi:aryl-alcohol dehydrogenase-like predicted oxidoreductase